MAIGFTDRSGLPPKTSIGAGDVVIVCTPVSQTKAAVLVRDACGVEAWLPRKSIRIEDGISQLRITMPGWLAIEKGLRGEAPDGQKTLF